MLKEKQTPATALFTIADGQQGCFTTAPKVLILHRGAVPKADREARQGYEVTRPLRTLLDVLAEGKILEQELIRTGKDAVKKGLITYKEIHKRKPDAQQNAFLKSIAKA